MKFRSLRHIFLCCCASTLVVVGGCRKKEAPPSPSVTIRTSVPTERIFQAAVETQGVVESVDAAVISALIPGKLEELRLNEGDQVKAGAVLFRSDRQNLENRHTLARQALKMTEERLRTRNLDIELAKFKLKKAEIDFNRSSRLFKDRSVSADANESAQLAYQAAQIALDKAHADAKTAQAEVDFAKATLEITGKRLSDSSVTAPYDGTITAKFRQENEFCNAGTPVLKLESPTRKRVVAALGGIHYPQIRRGKTLVEVGFAGKKLCQVPVTIVPDAIDPVSRTFEVKADLPEGFSLPPGTLLDVAVILAQRTSLALPEEAVLFRKNGTFVVFEERDGKAHIIPVRMGITRQGFAEILDRDRIAGRKIIVSGQYFVNDGTAVRPADAE
ncbi:MAG: efflux RND transporter periplasmic adaptor subunit [Victivallaceae bacterium]|nr:efflux RND transporter periplasmic adaptor subunit [Victivallaceae bacterium]